MNIIRKEVRQNSKLHFRQKLLRQNKLHEVLYNQNIKKLKAI